jgi:transcriptional regulator with XRE-family HTH domain
LNELLQPYVLGRQQKTVWQRAGVSASWLSTRKQGTTAISADDIYVLARGLQCDPCDFFALEVEPAPVPSREDRETSFIPTEADVVARELVAGWDDLPERERRFLRGLAELRREYREGDDDDG